MALVLLIMPHSGNLRVLTQALERYGHECKSVTSPESLKQSLQEGAKPNVALMDIVGFGEAAWTICERLQSQRVPFVVLSAKRDLKLTSRTLTYGARSILEKPVVKDSLLALISEMAKSEA